MSMSMNPHSARRRAAPTRPTRLAVVALACATWALAAPGPAQAQDPGSSAWTTPAALALPAQPLPATLAALSRRFGTSIGGEGALLEGKTAPALQGSMTLPQALERVLAGSGLRFVRSGTSAVTVLAAPAAGAATLATVTVAASTEPAPHELPAPAPGGQLARGAQIGMLGNRSLMETPFSVSAYTAQIIQDQQAKSLADVLANEASIRSDWSSRGGYSDNFILRGFQVNAGDVAFGGLFGIAPRTYIPIESIERVEVFRGVSALLNGVSPSGSLGGVINLVPKRAGDAPLSQVTASYESGGYFAGHLDLGRRFGPDQALGVRLNAMAGQGGTATDRQHADVRSLSAGLDYRSPGVRLSADLGYLDRRTEASMRPAAIGAGLTRVPDAPRAGTNFAQPWGFVELSSVHGMLRGEVDLSPRATAYAAVGFRKNPTDLLVSIPTLTGANGNFTERNLNFFDDVDNQTAEAGLRAHFATGAVHHQLSASASTLWQERLNLTHTVSTHNSNLYQPTPLAPPDLSGYDTQPRLLSKQRLSGIAVADTLSFLDETLQLTLGLRFQRVVADGYNGQVPSVRNSTYGRSATTPAVALLVKPLSHLSLYANYIEGLSQGPTAPTGTTNAGEVFAPYVTRQYEVGAKLDTGQFTTTLGLFQMTQPSAFSTPGANGGLPTFGVDGEQRNRGVELSGFGELARGVRLQGGVMLLDAVLTRTAGGTHQGKTAIGSPRTQINLGLEWDPAFAPGLTLSAGAVHTGVQYVNASNTLRIPAWSRLDLGVGYRTKMGGLPLVLRARMTNVADKSYWAAASPGLGALSVGAPRTLALSATVGF